MGLNQAFYENGSEVDFFHIFETVHFQCGKGCACLEGYNFVKNEHFLMK